MSDPYAAALGLDDTAPLRANNPGALMPGGKLAQYSTPADGLSALDANLAGYGRKGINTLSGVIQRWAPPNENDTAAYIRDASQRLGIKPDQAIDLSDPVQRHAIGTAILLHENGSGSIFKGGAAPTHQEAANDPYAAALGLTAGPASQPSASPTAAAITVPTSASRDHPAGPSSTQGGNMFEMALTGASALGASVVGGYRGVGTLLSGGTLNDAANAVRDTQEKYTYQSSDPATQQAQEVLSTTGGNPANLPKIIGGAAGDALAERGYPGLATVADVGTQFGLPIALSKAGAINAPKVAPPRIEPTMSEPPVTPAVTAAAPAATVPKASDSFTEPAPDVRGGLPPAEQARRAAILQQIGLTGKVRDSAITGDSVSAGTDFQTSRIDSPAGRVMKGTLDNEKRALSTYADNLVQQTGGSLLNDQAAKLGRGETILAPMEAMQDYFENQTRQLYQVADERAQGVPTHLDGFRSVLGDDSLATNSDRVQLRTAIGAYARKLGIVDDQGNVFANGQQAETMRKYLNENWSPQTSGLIGKLKDALDDDVMQSAGEDVYAAARQMRSQRAALLENPNGIAKILDASGPNGVNRKVPVEKVADTLTNMPVAQLSHIVDALKGAPEEIQPQAQAALSEIQAQFAHNVSDIGGKHLGQWNAPGVTAYLNGNSARMQSVFSPSQMQAFGTLNDAGHILAKDQSYPGAAAQGHNLVRAGVLGAVQHGTTAAGAALAGPVGAFAGNVVGSRLVNNINDAAEVRSVQKRLRDMVPRQNQ